MRIVATIAIVIVGLVLLRWVAAVTASPAPPSGARVYPDVADLPSVRVPVAEPTLSPVEQIDRDAAYAEAMRLARESLLEDELITARDLYLLATEALPGDPDAEGGLRQVETVLTIQERTTAWREALDDVEALLPLAPRSLTVAGAYTDALIGAGGEALAQGNPVRAQRLCSDAVVRAPARNDARLCASQAAATATAVVRALPANLAPATPIASPPILRSPESTAAPRATNVDATVTPPVGTRPPAPAIDRP